MKKLICIIQYSWQSGKNQFNLDAWCSLEWISINQSNLIQISLHFWLAESGWDTVQPIRRRWRRLWTQWTAQQTLQVKLLSTWNCDVKCKLFHLQSSDEYSWWLWGTSWAEERYLLELVSSRVDRTSRDHWHPGHGEDRGGGEAGMQQCLSSSYNQRWLQRHSSLVWRMKNLNLNCNYCWETLVIYIYKPKIFYSY